MTKLPATIAACGLALLAGCATTQKTELKRSELNCGLLGARLCSQLQPGSEEQAGLRWINPAARWTQYSKVMIEPVSYWGDDKDQISPDDQQAIVNYFNQTLREELGKKFTLVDQPAAGVMRIQVALTNAETATPVMRSVSMVVPQAHMLSNISYVATGSFPFVGGAQVEAKVSDAATGAVLAAIADRRLGGGSFGTGLQWKLGDIENAMKLWSETAAARLSAWTSGSAKP
jgi:hypothetical protein